MKGAAIPRIETYLKLIPQLYAHGAEGMPVSELRELAGFSTDAEVSAMIQELMMWGSFPFGPGDFISIWQEGDRVFLESPQGLEEPFALEEREILFLQYLIEQLTGNRQSGQESQPNLLSVLGKLSGGSLVENASGPGQKKRELISEALAEKLQLQFLYRSLSSKTPEVRRIDPWLLFHAEGQSYVSGHCYLRGEARYFHLDRMDEPVILHQAQENPPPDNLSVILRSSPIFQRGSGFQVRVRYAPGLKKTVDRYLKPVQVKELEDGNCEALIATQSGFWLRSLLRSMGPQIEILEPEHMRQSMAAELEALPVPELLS
ncbi:MAG: WYL domain-containing protein [Spirochaetales bacterium]|nr:WYL domain-containing protein [Spirochaetales bacterium]